MMARFRVATAVVLILSAALWLGTVLHAAQDAGGTDIDEGAATFRSYCATCHGIDGNEVAGIDLGRGEFRRAVSNQESQRDWGSAESEIQNVPLPSTSLGSPCARRSGACSRRSHPARRHAIGIWS